VPESGSFPPSIGATIKDCPYNIDFLVGAIPCGCPGQGISAVTHSYKKYKKTKFLEETWFNNGLKLLLEGTVALSHEALATGIAGTRISV